MNRVLLALPLAVAMLALSGVAATEGTARADAPATCATATGQAAKLCAISQQAAALHGQFVNTLSGAAGSYS